MVVDPILLLLRWPHILAAVVAMGALFFARFALVPTLEEFDEETRDRIHEGIRKRWLPWVMAAITLLIASGTYNFLAFNDRVKAEGWGDRQWMRTTSYHALFGVKLLLAMGVFYLASALGGRGAGTAWARRDRRKWLTIALGLSVAVIILSGWMRQLHTGENERAGSSGIEMEVRMLDDDRPAPRDEAETRRPGDGQEGQEAAGGAPAEDREAPAAAGGGEEAAR